MSSPLVAPPVAQAKALYCPNCGGPVERRGFGHTLSVTCPQCLTVLDVSTPLVSVLQQVEVAYRRQPIIALGLRGKLHGVEWETIGYQVREIVVEGEHYEWEEYLLFNPYAGFRYLTQYSGHWNWVEPSGAQASVRGKHAAYSGHWYRYFASAVASTTYVLGEFPWQVKVGEQVRAVDFVSPPYVLSAEVTPQEITWSRGVYMSPKDVWKAFGLPGSPPRPSGVYLNQPSPYAGRKSLWGPFLALAAVLLVMLAVFALFSSRKVVVDEQHTFTAASTAEPSYVTPVFEVSGRPAPLEIALNTDLSNNYAYFNLALINDDTGDALNFGREVSYYFGRDSDGAWTEGNKRETILVPSVPAGHYYLRVEPEMDTGGSLAGRMNYELRVREDVPYYGWFLAAGVLLLIPPVLRFFSERAFEGKRWAEGDGARFVDMSPPGQHPDFWSLVKGIGGEDAANKLLGLWNAAAQRGVLGRIQGVDPDARERNQGRPQDRAE